MEDKYRPNSCINGLVCSLGHLLQSNQFNLYIEVNFDLYDHSSLGKKSAIHDTLAIELFYEWAHEQVIGKKQGNYTHHFLPRVLNNSTAAAPAITVVIPKPISPSIPHFRDATPLCCTMESSCWWRS